MAEVTYEDAKRCPECGQPGKVASTQHRRDGNRIELIECGNMLCPWYTEQWAVQIRPDGTIPVRNPKDKIFQPVSPDRQAFGQRIVEDAVRRDLRGE